MAQFVQKFKDFSPSFKIFSDNCTSLTPLYLQAAKTSGSLKSLKQSYEQFGGAAQAKMTRSPNSNPAPFKLPFQPRAWQEEVAAGEGRQGCEAVNGVCEPAPDGDEQQCDNRQHVKGAWAWAKLSMTVTVKPLVGTKYVE